MPDQRLNLQECLHAYSEAGRFADFADRQSGPLAVGMTADLVLLEGDLSALARPSEQWPRVWLTICAGQIIYDKYA